jgi:hypothetical protein
MQLSAARTELQARGFDHLSSARCLIMLNRAKNALEDEYPWPWLHTSTTGTAPLTISDLKHIQYVSDTSNDRTLTGVDLRWVREMDASADETGTPQVWWLDGETTLRVWPLNTSINLSVRYVKFSPELSADGDTPLIPTRYHPVWVDYAVVEAYKDADDYANANALLQHLRMVEVPRMIAHYANRNLQNPEAIAVTYASEDW